MIILLAQASKHGTCLIHCFEVKADMKHRVLPPCGSGGPSAMGGSLVLLLVFAALGALIGAMTERLTSAAAGDMELLLRAYSRELSAGVSAVWLCRNLFLYFRGPVLALLFSGGPWGRFLLPLLAAGQGFLLALCVFSVCACQQGFLLALCTFSLRFIFSVPATLYIASCRLARLTGRAARESGTALQPVKPFLFCGCGLMLGALADTFLMSKLVIKLLAS